MAKTHGMFTTPEYKVWAAMVQRCTNPNDKRWAKYGGRGITVCERWRLFANFIADIGERPAGMSLERIDNERGYCPENCRWDTPNAQARNKGLYRSNRTGVAGVVFRADIGKYRAEIGVDGRQVRLGTFESIEQAIAARRAAEATYWHNPHQHA